MVNPDNILDSFGSADRAALDRRMEAIKKRRAQVEAERTAMQNRHRVEVAHRDALRAFVGDAEALQAHLPTLPYADKREFLVSRDVRVTVYATEDGLPGHVCDVTGLPMPVRGLYVPPPVRRWRNGRAEGNV